MADDDFQLDPETLKKIEEEALRSVQDEYDLDEEALRQIEEEALKELADLEDLAAPSVQESSPAPVAKPVAPKVESTDHLRKQAETDDHPRKPAAEKSKDVAEPTEPAKQAVPVAAPAAPEKITAETIAEAEEGSSDEPEVDDRPEPAAKPKSGKKGRKFSSRKKSMTAVGMTHLKATGSKAAKPATSKPTPAEPAKEPASPAKAAAKHAMAASKSTKANKPTKTAGKPSKSTGISAKTAGKLARTPTAAGMAPVTAAKSGTLVQPAPKKSALPLILAGVAGLIIVIAVIVGVAMNKKSSPTQTNTVAPGSTPAASGTTSKPAGSADDMERSIVRIKIYFEGLRRKADAERIKLFITEVETFLQAYPNYVSHPDPKYAHYTRELMEEKLIQARKMLSAYEPAATP